jgi:lysophospholipase L1-like esterase
LINKSEINEKKTVAILGDSVVKDIKGWELSDSQNKVILKSFSGATTKCMESHVIPTKALKPDVIILHCGTNDLRKTSTDIISKNIVNLAISLKTDTNSILVSGLTSRKDQFNDKVNELNMLLLQQTSDRNIGFIDNSNIDENHHLNKSKIHLNRKGSTILAKNFESAIKN